ncbi:MAG: hypothetical protein PUB76_05070 [Oscillospiraceae bacterium]|nr:hypothetical protein [Oscillospiraceae bacterium]MDY3257411.1 hypothetical protein [Ruminococcus callidus]
MKYEKLTMEIIDFLQKWGLWECTVIYSDGNMYAYSSKKTDTYNDKPHVKFKKNVDPIKCTSEYINGNIQTYSNPEKLFDMVFDSSLYTLLVYEDYEVNGSDLSDEAWEEIFQHTDLINIYTDDKYDVYDAEDVLERIVSEDDTYLPLWNALKFDSWDDYLNFYGADCLEFYGINNLYNTKNRKLINGYEVSSIEDVMPIWEKLSEIAKNEIINKYKSERLYLPRLADYITRQFNEIFKKYGLWYDFGFNWSLSCYKI